MTEAEYGAQLVDLIDAAARAAPWLAGKLQCVVSFGELAALMAAGGPERLRFARGAAPVLWTSVGLVHLDARAVRPDAPFLVTTGATA